MGSIKIEERMTDLMDQLYSAHQILIPPSLPSILKKYAKAAIRTQPRDLLLWSYYYFKAISNGLPPPVKERIEYPLPETASGLTPGFLKVIYNQIGAIKTVPKEVIEEKWENICLEKEKVEMLFKVGSFSQEVDWMKFLAIAAGSIEKNLTGTMSLLCELLTEEPEGGSSMIPVETFFSLYRYLASLNCGPDDPNSPTCIESSSEATSQVVETDIQYSNLGIEGSEDTWDTLIREMGQQDSEDTIATDDLREVDSKAGLIVWPDLFPGELKLKSVEESPRPSQEFVVSDTGLQVWDEEQFQNTIVEKVEIAEPSEVDLQESPAINQSIEDEARPVSEPELRQQVTVEMGQDKDLTDMEEGSEHLLEAEIEAQTPSDSSLKDQSENIRDELKEETEEKKDVNLEFIMEPDKSMILVPTPVVSRESLCSDQRSIKNITESDDEPSIGQKLITTASLKDLKVGSRKIKREEAPPPWAAGDVFWVHLPGIGPLVSQHVVDEVEVYLRQCAAKQCGMVMPRNLRHFLCPSLDGLVEEVYLESKEPECLECCYQAMNEDINKVITLPESATQHFYF